MKKHRHGFLVILSVILLSASVLHADDLTGKVLDPDGRTVPSASLRLFDRNTGELRSAQSTSDGNFVFAGIPPGDYLLEGDASDAALVGSRQVSVKGNQAQNLELKVSGRSTEVLVTAASVPLSIQETAKAIDVVDSAEIALRNEFSIGEAIRALPGVRVQTLEGPGSYTRIQTRGLRSQDTAVLIDGVRFHDASSITNDATGLLGDMTIVDIDRIEFLRGSGSSLYGSNALGGVINMTSRTGGGPTRGSLRVEGGGLGMVRGLLNVGGGLARDRFTYSGGISHLYVTNGVRDGLPFRSNSQQGSAKYNFAPGISITGRAWYTSNFNTLTDTPAFTPAVLANSSATGEVKAIALPIEELEKFEKNQPFNAGNATFIPSAIDPDDRRKTKFLSGMVLFQHQVSPSTSYRASYQKVDTHRIYNYGPLGRGDSFSAPRSDFDGYIDTFQARLDQKIGQNNLVTFGYEFEQEEYLSTDGSDTSNTALSNRINLKQRSNAVYVQDQINLFDRRLQLTATGRVQSFDLKSPEFQGATTTPYSAGLSAITVPTAYTGDGAVAYFIEQSGTKLRAHVGNSFRAPSGYERFGGGFGCYFGDPRLAPERAVAVDGGIDQWLFDSKLEVGGTAFYTNLQQMIRFDNAFAPGTDPFNRFCGGYANGGGGIARGVETSVRMSPTSGTKIRAAYTYTNSDSRTPTIAGTSYYKLLRLTPHMFALTATQWIARRTNVTFDLAAYSDYTITLFGGGARQFRFNGPVKADVMVRHDLYLGDRNVEVYGKVENMFGQRPYEDGFVGPKAWFITGARVNF